MPDIIVIDLVLISLFIQEVKHVLDGQRQGTPSMGCAEDSLKQVINKLLQSPLHTKQKEHFLSAYGQNCSSQSRQHLQESDIDLTEEAHLLKQETERS